MSLTSVVRLSPAVVISSPFFTRVMHTFAHIRSMRSHSHRRPTRLLGLGAVALALIAGACTESLPPATIASLRISPLADSFYTGQTSAAPAFQVQMLDAKGNTIADSRKISYSSTNTPVFTVDANTGAITGVSSGGGLYRATVGGKTIEATVRIIVPVARIQLITQNQTLQVGTTLQLQYNLLDSGNGTISGRTVGFTSTNPGIISVSGSGLVSAVAVGTATVTLVTENKTATVTFTVEQQPVASIRLTPAIPQLMRVGGQLQVSAQPLNAAGQNLTGRVVNWSSSNPTAATISLAGVVTALSSGTTTITAESEGRTASLPVTITEVPPKTITLSPSTFDLATGVTRQIIPVIVDSLGQNVTSLANRNVLWLSTNVAVANVSTSGVVTGVAAGTAKIRLTVDGVTSNDVTVNVSQQVASIRITPFLNQTMRVGATLQMTGTPLDNNSQPIAGKAVNWFTSNSSAATVSTSGLVTAVSPGQTTITAEADGKTASITVNVTLVPVGSVVLSPTHDTLVVGDSRQYTPVVRDTANRVITNLTGRTVNWQSSNVLNATVNGQGVVTAQAPGSSIINVTIDGVSSNDLTLQSSQVASLTISPSPATVQVGKTLQLTVVLRDAAGNVLTTTRPFTTFQSSNNAVATVSSTGIVSGLSIGGPVTITLGINGVNATVQLSVN